jgi:hypothetical protein
VATRARRQGLVRAPVARVVPVSRGRLRAQGFRAVQAFALREGRSRGTSTEPLRTAGAVKPVRRRDLPRGALAV